MQEPKSPAVRPALLDGRLGVAKVVVVMNCTVVKSSKPGSPEFFVEAYL
ncbi:MAG: hypothetical protein WAW63_01435 [Candidatus Saccharimonadales bacterium]